MWLSGGKEGIQSCPVKLLALYSVGPSAWKTCVPNPFKESFVHPQRASQGLCGPFPMAACANVCERQPRLLGHLPVWYMIVFNK